MFYPSAHVTTKLRLRPTVKKIGILGGVGWPATQRYYEVIQRATRKARGPMAAAPLLIESLNNAHLHQLALREDWPAVSQELARAARGLQNAGADMVVLACNTLHRCADEITEVLNVPFLSIVDAVRDELVRQRLSTVGIVGTRFMLDRDLYGPSLRAAGVSLIYPEASDRDIVSRISFAASDDCRSPESVQSLREVGARLLQRGAGAILFACTDLTVFVEDDCPFSFSVLDSARIHATTAAREALA
ncbi:MAG: amino acid racemase [Phycisphaerae bacterium]|nr:amino acid racemase [Phycisphaerae bacterium]